MCPGQSAGQSHLRRYYDSAVAQCISCYELFAAGGKPSAKRPPGELVEQLVLTYTNNKKQWVLQHHNKTYVFEKGFCRLPLGKKHVPWTVFVRAKRIARFALCINSSLYDYKNAYKMPAQTNRGITSTDKSKVGLPHICLGQRAGQSHLRWYLQLAVNCQPSYREGNAYSSLCLII